MTPLLGAYHSCPDHADNPLFAAETSSYANQPGQTIGAYTLREKIGEGGFGLVWRAEQTTPIRRQVALKVIKIGMDTLQVVARFNAERQTLALMDHPGIAAVYDAGTTSTGRPYFVMELVHGLPITTHCDTHQLTLPQRLRLFVEVCKAVQHAHQKGILHRDLKPPNILVVEVDGIPQPKIIDFGIAKALESEILPSSRFATRGDTLLGTPEYMSPEQAIPGNPDLDTRTDIYALGVVLHELLTGQMPQGSTPGKTAARLTGLNQTRHRNLRLPSSVASIFNKSQPGQTASPPTDAIRHLRGDLDWILLKTLAHDRSDRYESADALASDIINHLADRPISAGKPSLRLVATKFIRRNRTVVFSTLALLLTLSIATALTTKALIRESWMRRQADDLRRQSETQTKKAEETLDFLTRLLQRAGEHVKSGKNPEALRLALEELDSETDQFSSDPEVNQAIAGRTANIFYALRNDAKAHPLIEQQINHLSDSRPSNDPELLAARESFARSLYLQGQHQQSHQEYDALVTHWQSQIHTKDGPRRLFVVRRNRADVWTKTGRLKEALAEFADIRATATTEIHKHSSWPVLLRNHAEALTKAGQFEEAGKAYDEILRNLPLDSAEHKHQASTIHQGRSALLVKQCHLPDSIVSLQRAIELQEQAKGEDSPWLPAWLVELSRLLTAQDRSAEAISACQTALATVLRTSQSDRLHQIHRALADNYEAAGMHADAAASFQTASHLEMQMTPIPKEAWLDRSRTILHLAVCGRFSEASAATQSLHEIRSTWSSDPERTFDLSQIETRIAFTRMALAESRDAKSSLASVVKIHQLGIPIIEQFRKKHGRMQSPALPADILPAMEKATKARQQRSLPTSADLLAFDHAQSDRWLGSDLDGDLLQLAAALRITGQPGAAISLYQSIASIEPGKSPVRSRRHFALVLAAETMLQMGNKKGATDILSQMEARHRSGQELVTNTALLRRITSLANTGDPRPFTLAPK
jgi:serine/threonine protein kinase